MYLSCTLWKTHDDDGIASPSLPLSLPPSLSLLHIK